MNQKEILYKNEIIISTQTSKPPLFNYISLGNVCGKIYNLLKPTKSDDNKLLILLQEVFKMFMSQISLKRLSSCFYSKRLSNIPFITSFHNYKF